MGWKEAPEVSNSGSWKDAPEVGSNYKPSTADFVVANLGKGLTSAVGGLVDVPANFAKMAYGAGRIKLAEMGVTGESPSDAASHAPDITYPVSDALFYGPNGPEERKKMDMAVRPTSNAGRYAARAIQFVGGSPVGGLSVRNAVLAGAGGLTSQAAQDLFPNSHIAPVVGALLPAAINTAAQVVRSRPAIKPELEQTVKEGADAGYVAPPSRVRQDGTATLLESVSGKRRTEVGASMKNQPVTNRLIADDLSEAAQAIGKKLPEGQEVSADVLAELKSAGNDAYSNVRNLGSIKADTQYSRSLNNITKRFEGAARSFPDANKNAVRDLIDSLRVKSFDAGDALDQISILREDATKAFRAGDNALGFANKQAATAIEDAIDRALPKLNADPNAVSQYRAARVLLAKVSNAEDAFNPNTGNIDANVYRKLLEKNDKYLTGGSRLVGEYSRAFDNKATQLPEKVGGNVSKLEAAVSGASGVWGLHHYGLKGALLSAIPGALSSGARSIMFSKPYQNSLLNDPGINSSLLDVGPIYIANRDQQNPQFRLSDYAR